MSQFWNSLYNILYKTPYLVRQKFFYLLEKCREVKDIAGTENKNPPLLLFHSLWISCIRWRYDDRSRNRSTAVCRWGYLPVNVQSYWSNSSRERAADFVYAPMSRLRSYRYRYRYYFPPHIARHLFCWQANFMCYFFYFELAKLDDKRRCGNVYGNSKSQEFHGSLDYKQIECVLYRSQRDTMNRCVYIYIYYLHNLFITNRKFVLLI